MIIDAHQHLWRYDAAKYAWIDDSMTELRHDFLPCDLQRELRANGVDATIAVQARQDDAETQWLIGLASSEPFIKGVVGWVDFQAADVEQRLAVVAHEPRLVGLRHSVDIGRDLDADRPAVTRLVARNLDPEGLIRHYPGLCPLGGIA